MSRRVIEVQHLGKRYHLGKMRGQRQPTFREMLGERAKALAKRLSGKGGEAVEGEFWALRDVGFSVEEGEVTAIIGRNGAGKSTLLKILSRITEPTTGRARLVGRVASLLEVGTGFHPELTGRENIFLNGVILGLSRREVAARFDQIAAFAEVEPFLDTPVKRYSSGMQARLAFAVAAHLEPEVLVVDEVLAVGDAQFQKRCLGRIREVSAEGRTVLLVSHNLSLVRQHCSRAMLLEKGRMVEDGPVDDVVDRYLRTAGEEPAAVYQRGAGEKGGVPCIERVAVTQGGRETDVVESHLPVEIFISYAPGGHGLARCVMMIHHESGTCVHHSSDELLPGAPAARELVARRCELPPHALNRGRHRLTVTLMERGRTVHERLEGVVTFTVRMSVSHGPVAAEQDWHGATAPGLLEWTEPAEHETAKPAP